MTPTDCVKLVRFVAARCPAMRMQDDTPEAWYVDLVEFDLPDAMEAVRRTTLDRTFIGIGDLVTECRAIVNRREGQRRLAEREAEIAAENPGELSDRSHPLRALMAGTPIQSTPRADWKTRRAITAAPKPPLTAEELDAARALLSGAQGGETG